jgi:hypothetical protein
LVTAACGPTGDTDGERVMDRLEVCGYKTDPGNEDSDLDRFVDGDRTAASWHRRTETRW